MPLDELRKEIDGIDREIVSLLNRRYRAAAKVGEWKRARNAPIYVPEREKNLLDKLDSLNGGPASPETVHAVYREIMSGALSLENGFKVAYTGNKTTADYLAAFAKFGSSIQYVPCQEIAGTIDLVESGRTDCGCIGVGEAYLLLNRPGVRVCGKTVIRMNAGNRYFYILRKTSAGKSGDDVTCSVFKQTPQDAVNVYTDGGYAVVETAGHETDTAEELAKRPGFLRIVGSCPRLQNERKD